MKAILGKFMTLFIVFSFVFMSSPVLAKTLKHFSLIGSGVGVPPEANYDDPTVTVNFKGVIPEMSTSRTISRINLFRVRPGFLPQITYAGEFTILTTAATPTANGGICMPANGTVTITDIDGSTLTFKGTGQDCTVGPMEELFPNTFNGTYYITGGTGRFSGASGSGCYTFGVDDETGKHKLSLNGTISY